MKLLTLALPIYNGSDCISLTLESIQEAFKYLDKGQQTKIEVIVSDNKSTDDTRNNINMFNFSSLNLSYYCNEENVGYDGNIDLLVQRSNARYVWFLGCGEKIKQDSLLRLIQKLDSELEYTNILLDFDIFDERKNIITDKKVFDFEQDILISSKNDFSYTKYGPAVSSNIINKNKWILVQKNKFVVNGWAHIERILDMISLEDNSKTLLLQGPYFTLWREENGWWTRPNSYLLLLLLLHIKVIRSMIDKGYDANIVKNLELKQSRIALLMAIVQSKEFGMTLSIKVIKNMLELFKYDYFFWLFAFPLLLLPKQLMIIPRYIFKMLRKIKSSLKNV